MESGRFLLAVILMIAVVIVTNVIFPPMQRDPAGTPPDSAAAVTATPELVPGTAPATGADPGVGTRTDSTAPATPEAPAAPVAAGAADTVWVNGPLWRYGISTAGGSLVHAGLAQYESQTTPGQPVQLAPQNDALLSHRLRIGERTIDLATLSFEPSSRELQVAEGAPATLTLTHAGQPRIQLTYTFDPATYLFDVSVQVAGAGAAPPQLLLDMGPTLRANDANLEEDERALAYVVNSTARGIESRPLRNVESEHVVTGPLVWVAVKNKYFLLAALQSEQAAMPFGGLVVRPTGQEFEAELAATVLPNPEGVIAYRAYVGPQQYDHLSAVGHQLNDVNPMGWRFLQPILRPLGHGIIWALSGMHNVFGLAYGWVLVLFGVLIRILLWPLNAKAMRAQMKNMEVQPKLKDIQSRYKNDPERLQKEMLRLYKEEGFNPMGGCLPMLIPFPLLIALFFVFQSTIEFRDVSFLWLPDLSQKDPLYILPILLGGSMFALQWLSMRTSVDQNPQMKFMMYFMPLFMTVIFLNFASGLNLYYASMNFASVPQQLQIMRERKRWQAGRQPAPATR
jgi:YidC/Oxa1 family membrane protein insertase